MQSFNRCFATLHLWKAALAIVYTAFCSCYVIITDFCQSSNYKDMMKAIKNFFYNVMFNVLMGDKPVYEYV